MSKIIKGYKQLVAEAEAEIETIPVEQVQTLLNDEDTIIVDIRDVRELWKEGKIPGSVHAPRGMLEFWVDPASPYHRDVFDHDDKKYVLYCGGAWRSALAARDLKNMGMTNVAHMAGGFNAWKEAQAPIEPVEQKTKRPADDNRPVPIDPALVQEFVSKAHSDLAAVKEMLMAEPRLINVAWDWGGGDFETALGAAAHMGQREMALYLLEKGARLDLPTAVMLGWLEVVKAILSQAPEMRHVPGAHGIPLMAHAKFGGEPAAGVLAYLQSFNDTE